MRWIRLGPEQKELEAKLKAWNEQVVRAPMLEQIAKGQLRTQCLSTLSDFAKRKQALPSLEEQLRAEQQTQTSLARPATTSVGPQAMVLNQTPCTVR